MIKKIFVSDGRTSSLRYPLADQILRASNISDDENIAEEDDCDDFRKSIKQTIMSRDQKMD